MHRAKYAHCFGAISCRYRAKNISKKAADLIPSPSRFILF